MSKVKENKIGGLLKELENDYTFLNTPEERKQFVFDFMMILIEI